MTLSFRLEELPVGDVFHVHTSNRHIHGVTIEELDEYYTYHYFDLDTGISYVKPRGKDA